MYDVLPPELWVQIVDYSGEISLLLTNTSFFELLNLVNIKMDIIEYVTDNNLIDVLKYLVLLKKLRHQIIVNKNILSVKSLNRCLIDNCKKNQLEIIKFLVSLGADIRAKNDYAVRLASENGHLEVVKYLVSQGADIRAKYDYAVRLASQKGHIEVVKYLVSQGADIKSENDCAVIYASRNGHL